MSDWDKFLTKGVPTSSGGQVPVRKELNDLSDEELFLYIEGLRRFQAEPAERPLSYFQIAGIHGLPYTTWPDASWNKDIKRAFDQGDFGGFCTHSSVLFLTWHRPYLALYESALYAHVSAAADSIDASSPDKAKYQALAKNFRMPYWDWARRNVSPFPPAASTNSLTDKGVFKSPTFKPPKLVANPNINFKYNPLYAFPFQAGTSSDIKMGYSSTVRYPTRAGGSDNQVVIDRLRDFIAHQRSPAEWGGPRDIERNLSERVAYILKSYSQYGPMCTNAIPPDARGVAGRAEVWGSFEDIHNAVHTLVGGGGHMSGIERSAFDPIFWLHHANIDRLFAIWQALHESTRPDTYVTEWKVRSASFAKNVSFMEDEGTPLWPFRLNAVAGNDRPPWWTSQSARRTESLGYAYPETAGWQFPGTVNARAALNNAIDQYYSNPATFIRQSKQSIPTAGASLLPQAALLKKIDETQSPATISTMQQIDAKMPEPQVLLEQSLKPDKPFLRDLAPNNKYLEWLVDVRAEKHALGGGLQVHFFLGPVEEENVVLWPFSPNHVGTFATLGQNAATGCEKCQQDQADHTEVTGQIPLTLALTERYLAELIPDISRDTVVPYLTRNLHWRVILTGGDLVPDRSTVPGLKVLVASNEVTLSDDPNVPPVYAPDVVVYPEITTDRDGQGRGDGTGVTAGDLQG